jgi:GxxExxY protein
VQHKELTGRIIGAAITVHKALGPGFLESVYEAALAGDFDLAGIQYERQKRIQIFYRDRQVGEHRLDFIVEQAIYVALKATQDLADVHFAIVRSGLKAAKLEHGLILNFATMPLTIKRVGREDPARQTSALPDFLIS